MSGRQWLLPGFQKAPFAMAPLFVALLAFSESRATPSLNQSASLSKGAVLEEILSLEGELEDLTTQVEALRRVTLGDVRDNFAIRRDAEQEARRLGRAEFHARTREHGAAERVLEEGRVPLFDIDSASRRLTIEFAAARSVGDARRVGRVCRNFLASPNENENGKGNDKGGDDETLLLCAVSFSELSDPLLPNTRRLEKTMFKAFALHTKVRTAPKRLAIAIALVPGFTQFGEPDAALTQLREALAHARADDAWRPRAHFVEALLRYQLGETDGAIDAWRYLSGERLNAFSGIDLPQEKVDARTRVLALHQCARAFAARAQWKAANDAYARLLSLPETFQSAPLETSRKEAAKVLFPFQGVFPPKPSLYSVSSRNEILEEAARVQWESGDVAAAGKLWEASGALPSPPLLAAMAKDPARRDAVSLKASQALGEARADARSIRALSALPASSQSVARFTSLKSEALAVLSIASLHGDSDAAQEARRLLSRWKPLLVSEKDFFFQTALRTEALLGPVDFLDKGVLERKEGIALEVLARRWKELYALVRRAHEISRLAWRPSVLSEAHAQELWRRLESVGDVVFTRLQILQKKSFRDNHRESAQRLSIAGNEVLALDGVLASLRLLRSKESKRQLEKGTVGVVSLSSVEAEIFRLEREREALESTVAEASLELRLLILTNDDVFPPYAERNAALGIAARTLQELSGLHRRSFREEAEFASGPVRARLVALWESYEGAAQAFRLAASDILGSALARRRELAGEVLAILGERNAYARGLAQAQKASTTFFEQDIRAAASVLVRHLEAREDAMLGVMAAADGARWQENVSKRAAIERAQRERAALIEAYRTSIDMGSAR